MSGCVSVFVVVCFVGSLFARFTRVDLYFFLHASPSFRALLLFYSIPSSLPATSALLSFCDLISRTNCSPYFCVALLSLPSPCSTRYPHGLPGWHRTLQIDRPLRCSILHYQSSVTNHSTLTRTIANCDQVVQPLKLLPASVKVASEKAKLGYRRSTLNDDVTDANDAYSSSSRRI